MNFLKFMIGVVIAGAMIAIGLELTNLTDSGFYVFLFAVVVPFFGAYQ